MGYQLTDSGFLGAGTSGMIITKTKQNVDVIGFRLSFPGHARLFFFKVRLKWVLFLKGLIEYCIVLGIS